MSVGRIITSDACVAEGAAYLAGIEPRFARALGLIGALPLRLKSEGFETLLDAIVSQQVSLASAKSIWDRLQAAGFTDEAKVRSASQTELLGCGLSRPKARYVKALAEKSLNYKLLRNKVDEQVLYELTSLLGIGPWTAQIYALSSLGRSDVFPAGDLALQESARCLFELDARPSEKQMAMMAQDWAPWRSVAARLLWAYYPIAKEHEGKQK